MRLVTVVVFGALVNLATFAAAAAPADAQAFSSNPGSGPAGTAVQSHSIEPCTFGSEVADVEVTTPGGRDVVGDGESPVDTDNNWAVATTIDADAPPGPYSISATCLSGGDDALFQYAPNAFTIT